MWPFLVYSRYIDLTAVRSRSHSGRRRLEPAAHKTKSIRLKSKAAITPWSNGSGTLLLGPLLRIRLVKRMVDGREAGRS